ncbi:MAG: methyltransferase domain-containing protein, partial [Candidatus Omnitrophica bacterium]|nr:methyltransferase domain-containing protein [Candidatus Omnitrophota bacterium]
ISLSGGKIIEFYLPTFFSKEGIIFWDNNTKELKEKREYLDNLLIALLDLMIEKAKNLEGVEIWRGFIEEARDIKSRLYIPSQDSERLVRNIKEYFFKDKLPDVCDNTLEDTENNKEEFRYTDVDSIVLSWDSSIDLLKMWLENKGEKLDLNGKRILFVGAETEKVPNELKRKYPSSTIIVVNPRKDWLKYHLSKEIIFINDIIQNIPNYKISDIDLIFSSGLFNIEWQKNVVGKGSYKDKLDIMFKAMASVLNDNGIILITTGIDDNPIMEEAAKKNNLKIKMISKKSFIYCIYKERNQNGIDWDEIDELLDQDISHLVSNRQKGDFAPCSTGKISKIFNKINIPDSAKVLDLGSGTAKLCILLSLYNDKFLGKRIEITGIEYYPDIYNIGVIKKNHFTMLGYDLKNIDLIQGDFFEFSWQKYDIIFYAARGSREEEKITQKLIKELKTGGKFVMFSSIGVERCFYNERAFFMPQLFNENIFAIEYFPELGVIIFTKKNNPYHRACGWGVYEFDKLKEKGRLTDSAKAKTINILMKAKNEGRLIKFNELPNLLPYQSIHNLIIKHYKIKEMLSNHSLYLLLPKDEEFLNSFYSSYLWYETPNRFLVATSGNYQEVFDDKRCVHIIPLGLIVLLLSKEHYCPEILIDILNHESKINNFSLAYIKESEDLAKKVFLVSATDNLLDAGINYCITQQAEWLRRDNKDSFEAKLLFKLLSMKIFDSNGEELRRVAKILGILEGKEATPYLSERLKQVTSDEERLALLEGFISTNSDYLFSNYNDILRLTKVDNIFKDRTNTPKMRVKALELLNSLLIYSNQWEGLINLLLKIISDYEEKKEVLERAIRDSRVWLMVDCRREEIINKYKEFKEELGKYEDLKAQGSKKRIQKIINFSISMGELFSKRKHKRITKFYQQLTSKRGNMFISLFPLLLCEGTEFVWLKICMLGLASLFIYFIIRNIYVLNNIDYSLLLSIGHKLKMILFEFHRRKKFIYFLYSINSNNELTKFKSSRKFFGWVRCIFTLIKEFGLKILAFLFMLDTQIILAYIKKYGLIRPDPLTFCNHNNIRFIVICVFIIILSMFLSYYSNIFPILNKILTNFSVSYFTKTPLNLGILFGFLIPLVRKESSQKNIIQIKKEALLNVLRQSRSVRGTERDLSTALTEEIRIQEELFCHTNMTVTISSNNGTITQIQWQMPSTTDITDKDGTVEVITLLDKEVIIKGKVNARIAYSQFIRWILWEKGFHGEDKSVNFNTLIFTKARLSTISSIRDTVFDPNNKDGIWEEVSFEKVRLRTNYPINTACFEGISDNDLKQIFHIIWQARNYSLPYSFGTNVFIKGPLQNLIAYLKTIIRHKIFLEEGRKYEGIVLLETERALGLIKDWFLENNQRTYGLDLLGLYVGLPKRETQIYLDAYDSRGGFNDFFGCGLLLPKRWLKFDGSTDLSTIYRDIKSSLRYIVKKLVDIFPFISSLFSLNRLYFKYPRLTAYVFAPLLENLCLA